MHKRLEEYARHILRAEAAQCTEEQQLMFKRMYAHGHLDWPLDKVIDQMPTSKLETAMDQVTRTLEKNSRRQGL